MLTALDELINERVEKLLAPHRVLEVRRQGDDLVIYFDTPNPWRKQDSALSSRSLWFRIPLRYSPATTFWKIDRVGKMFGV
ncbi:hypothetical protein CVV65_14315 [Kyrpidia spormannii]|uniref:Uncharacterized protein n=1 Tax=Kyrpidia spormannii TaxID=2055160 RepID=A0A2K8NC16_9BACL|nr:hypothetical protein [Kyrpidia spormannii]ATY85952.1 hypothetical protein CVV65_14315 [Kyrpidia spormannii]